MVKPAFKRPIIDYLKNTYRFSERQSCRLAGISRRTYRYRSVKNDDQVIEVLGQFSQDQPGYGFWMLFRKIRKAGYPWNHKRVYRVYTKLQMNLRRRVRKRLPKRISEPLSITIESDLVWSMDFMSDSLYDGRRFRILNIIDDYNREILAMEIGHSISSERLVRVLDRLKEQDRLPKKIRVDNGPEFISGRFQLWCRENGIQIHDIQPGKPTQNGFIERFNGSCRRELLDIYVFKNIPDVEDPVGKWWNEYNYHRPHSSLKNLTPMEYKQKFFMN